MALGADRRRILGMVLRESGMLVALGLAAGSVLWLAAATAALLAAVALAAGFLPARRAAKLDPMAALRDH